MMDTGNVRIVPDSHDRSLWVWVWQRKTGEAARSAGVVSILNVLCQYLASESIVSPIGTVTPDATTGYVSRFP